VRNTTAGHRRRRHHRHHRQRRSVVGRLDLSDQASVAAFAADWTGPLNLLIGNAGVILPDLQRTPEGWELTFATNHSATSRSRSACATHSPPAGHARIVSVSSAGHRRSPVIFDDIQLSPPARRTLAVLDCP